MDLLLVSYFYFVNFFEVVRNRKEGEKVKGIGKVEVVQVTTIEVEELNIGIVQDKTGFQQVDLKTS